MAFHGINRCWRDFMELQPNQPFESLKVSWYHLDPLSGHSLVSYNMPLSQCQCTSPCGFPGRRLMLQPKRTTTAAAATGKRWVQRTNLRNCKDVLTCPKNFSWKQHKYAVVQIVCLLLIPCHKRASLPAADRCKALPQPRGIHQFGDKNFKALRLRLSLADAPGSTGRPKNWEKYGETL